MHSSAQLRVEPLIELLQLTKAGTTKECSDQDVFFYRLGQTPMSILEHIGLVLAV